jgi:CRISPR-associated protein Csx10
LLGGSRTAGYGKAKIVCAPGIEVWSETGKAHAIKKDDEFTIILLSNALIRDGNGQFQTEIDSLFATQGKTISGKTFKRAELIGGFNRKWGLPLPQQLSIKAGSVFKFKAEQDIDESTVQKWLEEGIGERRVEGFGRIAVYLNTSAELSFTDAEETIVSAIDLKSQSGTAQTLGRKIVERILRQKFEEAITGAVGEVKIKGNISNSQISRLRLVVRGVLRGEEATQIKGFFNDLKKIAQDQFDGVRIGNTKIEKWIAETLDYNHRLEHVVSPKLGGLEIVGDEWKTLQLEYHLRLIDGVLAGMAKESQP